MIAFPPKLVYSIARALISAPAPNPQGDRDVGDDNRIAQTPSHATICRPIIYLADGESVDDRRRRGAVHFHRRPDHRRHLCCLAVGIPAVTRQPLAPSASRRFPRRRLPDVKAPDAVVVAGVLAAHQASLPRRSNNYFCFFWTPQTGSLVFGICGVASERLCALY